MEDLADDIDEAEEVEEVVPDDTNRRGKSPDNPLPGGEAYYYIGPKREKIMAKELVTTSPIRLHNEKYFVDDDGKVKRASYMSSSSMATYAKCHQLYYRKYVLGEKDTRPAVKMWTGSGFHNTLEAAGLAKIAGTSFSMEEAGAMFKEHMKKEFAQFDSDSADLIKAGKNPQELKLPERIPTREALVNLGMDMVTKFLREEFPIVKPISVEKRVLYPLEMNSGGTIPFVGFIDLIEEENGEVVISDYKTGRLRTEENLIMDQQLPRYAKAEGVYRVKWFSSKLGTTGGKTPGRAKGPETLKLRRTVTVKDLEILHEDDNANLEGIKAGNFARTGLQNPMICSSVLCPMWHNCLGKK